MFKSYNAEETGFQMSTASLFKDFSDLKVVHFEINIKDSDSIDIIIPHRLSSTKYIYIYK